MVLTIDQAAKIPCSYWTSVKNDRDKLSQEYGGQILMCSQTLLMFPLFIPARDLSHKRLLIVKLKFFFFACTIHLLLVYKFFFQQLCPSMIGSTRLKIFFPFIFFIIWGPWMDHQSIVSIWRPHARLLYHVAPNLYIPGDDLLEKLASTEKHSINRLFGN